MSSTTQTSTDASPPVPLTERLPTPANELGLVAYVQWGLTGEVCVRGGNIMVEYLRQPEATAAALRDRWYQTWMPDADGYLFSWTG